MLVDEKQNITVQPENILTLTDQATEQVKQLLAREPEPGRKHLRVYVEGGGCSGLQYGLVFDEQRADDLAQAFGGVTVLVDPFSADYLRGTVVDFVDALNGGGFKIKNPNAKQSCGCGNSFEA